MRWNEEQYTLWRKPRENEMYRPNFSSFVAPARSWFLAIAALAGLTGSQVHYAFAQDAQEYPAGPGDQLQVVVYGEENTSTVLSGRFRIEQDGSIHYPLLGKIAVAGLSPVEIAKLLGESLSTQVRVNPPTVSIVEFAPVYLVGDAMRSGPFQFQPNMTVFQLVLQAGGIAREGGMEAARLSLLRDVTMLELSEFSFRLTRARLLAELDGAEFDHDAHAGPAGSEATSIISAEAAIFALRQRAKESRRRSYAAQREGYDQEISSIERSIVLHDEEVRLMEEQVGVQQDLAERGLAAQSARRDAQRQLAATRREALEFRTALFRARQNRIAVDQALAEAETRIDEENVKALREVELALVENAISLATAKSRLAQFEADQNAAHNALGRVPRYHLIRLIDDQYVSSVATQHTKLERGDIVRVDLAPEEFRPTLTE